MSARGPSIFGGLWTYLSLEAVPDAAGWRLSMRFALAAQRKSLLCNPHRSRPLFGIVHRPAVPARIYSLDLDSSPGGLVLCTGCSARSLPEWTSVLLRPTTVGSRLSHCFGWGCKPRAHCIDELLITMRFYASAAYFRGALMARLFCQRMLFRRWEVVTRDPRDKRRYKTGELECAV